MGIFSDRVRSEFEGHTLEVESRIVGIGRPGLMKGAVRLIIDNEVVDEIQITVLPGSWTLRGKIPGEERPKLVVVEITQPMVWSTRFRLQVAGKDYPLTKIS